MKLHRRRYEQPVCRLAYEELSAPQTCCVTKKAMSHQIERSYRREICEIGHLMYKSGFVVATEGNMSFRLDSNRFLVTPAGLCKGRLSPDDLLVTDLNGQIISGDGTPSSEVQMHMLYYRIRPDVGAVCHAHPLVATAFAAAGRALDDAILPEIVVSLGRIPLAPYGTPGMRDLCASIERLVPVHDAILLENHGVVTAGKNLLEAYQRLELVERFAQIAVTTELLGGARLLPRSEVDKLIAARPRYGVSCHPANADQLRTSDAPSGGGRKARNVAREMDAENSVRLLMKRNLR